MREKGNMRAVMTSGLFVVAGLLVDGCGGRTPAPPVSLEVLTNVVNEIMSVGEFYRSPEPNHALTELVFMRYAEGGCAFFKADFLSRAATELRRKAEARFLFGWSVDDQYLLLKDFQYNEGLRLYAPHETTFKAAAKEAPGVSGGVTEAAWLDAARFVYASKPAKGSQELRLVSVGEPHKVLRTFSNPGVGVYMTQMSEQKVAYVENHEIWTFDVQSGEAAQVTTNVSKQFRWLSYSPQKEEFLFCSIDDSDWRHLFRFSVNAQTYGRLRQLTFGPDHSYNGQWIQAGTGFAYVGNITNHFYLAVRPADERLRTNLFSKGHVISYRVGAEGNSIIAAAAIGAEAPGIWRYDVGDQKLQCVVPGTNAPFKFAKVISRTGGWIKSFDGLRIPYYMLAPTQLEASRTYPVVFSIPPENGQFMQAWEKYSQFLANIGVFQVAVNPRGSDGYGLTYEKMDSAQAHRDVLAVAKVVLKNSNVDRKRVYLLTWSNGSGMANRLAEEEPELLAGVIIISGGAPAIPQPGQKLPRYFMFLGERDPREFMPGVKKFKEWADGNGAEVTTLYDKKTAHHVTDINVDKRIGIGLAEFIFKQSYKQPEHSVGDVTQRPPTEDKAFNSTGHSSRPGEL